MFMAHSPTARTVRRHSIVPVTRHDRPPAFESPQLHPRTWLITAEVIAGNVPHERRGLIREFPKELDLLEGWPEVRHEK